MHDVRPEEYARVIRDLIWRENDVTNHRLMWLLVVQGLLANAFASRQILIAGIGIATGGILVALSAFVMLYKSYQARAYLRFVGAKAKQGRLPEEHLPIDGWPRKRIRDWRRPLWVCPWLERAGDVLEPYLFLPGLIIFLWVVVVLRLFGQSLETCVGVGLCLTPVTLFIFCVFWVWSERAYEQAHLDESGQSRDELDPGEADRRTPRSAA
jgi:hypothetical protein